jgi:GTP-binding protein Era
MSSENAKKKSGFVVLAGRSNVGKSTLLNTLVGSKVAIVTPKPQTTRHPIRGILHDPRGQVVFVDTPGIFLGKHDPVSKRLNKIVEEQFDGIEVIIYVVDPTRAAGPEEKNIQTILKALDVPTILVINKSDLADEAKPALEDMRAIDIGQRATYEISAKTHQNLNRLVDALFALLPEGEAYYPDFQLTDLDHKTWLEEVIREKIFLALQEELPYSVKVEITDEETRKNGERFVAATVWTTEERYKRMIIGAKGQMLKSIGMAARKELEAAAGDQKIYLELHVDVDANWQKRFV